MCGIVGRFHISRGSHEALTEADLSRLSHRGPDGFGLYADDLIQLGHTRLAIIDLTEAGKQPMLSHDKRYVIVFNGEIYNHIELRHELEQSGEKFFSNSDTEILLAAFNRWGEECVKHLRGMYAFAIWDADKKTLFLARDPCGEKPFFYYRDDQCFIFASEIKALVPLLDSTPNLNPAVVDMYLHYQFVPEPFTLLNDVVKLPAAHTLTISPGNWNAEPKRYWNVESASYDGDLPSDAPGILSEIRNTLEDSIKLTLRADVPVAVALSGGIDSGAIAAFAQRNYAEPMHAFCVGYPGEPPYDERKQAASLAKTLGMIFHEVELPVNSFVDFFPDLVKIMDEPIADPAAFGHYSVPKAVAESGIKVLLTGIGGDEVFWGYNWATQTALTNQALIKSPSLGMLAFLAKNPLAQQRLAQISTNSYIPKIIRNWSALLRDLGTLGSPSDQLHFYMSESGFPFAFKLKCKVYGSAMQGLSQDNPFLPTNIGLRKFQEIPAAIIRLLFETWMVSNAVALGDRVSMGVGVEARMPFLDIRLIELVMSLRRKTPDHALGQKAWLRSALRGVLPPDVLARPKAGFQPPVHDWLTGIVTKYGHILQGGYLVKSYILDQKKIENILTVMAKQSWPGLFFVYKLILLELWYSRVVR